MTAGRPKKADAGNLYAIAHQFYWDLKRISEGHPRWRYDEEERKQILRDLEGCRPQLNPKQNRAIAQVVIREVHEGRVTEAEKPARLHELASINRSVTLEWLRGEIVEMARKEEMVPGKPDVIRALLQAQTPERIRVICGEAFVPQTIEVEPGVTKQIVMPNWPISPSSTLPGYLSQYAGEFIAAKSDPRFPQSDDRPSSRLKQLWFLSRALAGALFGISTRTAINLVGSKTPEQVFGESRAGKPFRKVRER